MTGKGHDNHFKDLKVFSKTSSMKVKCKETLVFVWSFQEKGPRYLLLKCSMTLLDRIKRDTIG